MYDFEFKGADVFRRELLFWNPKRMSETIVMLDGWDGFESSIETIDVDGSVATITFNGNTACFELDTSSNIAERI